MTGMNIITHDSDCEHNHVDIRALQCSNGAVQYVKQCLTCGERVGSSIKKELAFKARGDLQFILPFDQAFRDAYRSKSYQVSRERREALARISRQQRAEEYALYLASPEWEAKRGKVLLRANGVCEGCLSAPAQVVHHTTYTHLFDELLFELVALCKPCHDKAHGK